MMFYMQKFLLKLILQVKKFLSRNLVLLYASVVNADDTGSIKLKRLCNQSITFNLQALLCIIYVIYPRSRLSSPINQGT